MKPAEFIDKYQDEVIRAVRGTTLLPSVKMAQMAIESGWGKSMPGNNAFGIKARGDHTPFWKGESTTASTREVIGGQSVYMNEPFRAYRTVADSIRDHTVFLARYSRYKPVFMATTAVGQAEALGRSGYATAPNYGQALINLMDRYDLYALDRRMQRKRLTRILVWVIIIIIIIVAVWKRKQLASAVRGILNK